ncbi:MAG: hypothetical protein VB102_14090 [Paludibacter sp.]|nr:hypothetical protein [Paludibacter sp.]
MKKTLLLSLLLLVSVYHFAARPGYQYDIYGFIRNEFYYNSRLNEEVIDGIFNLFPKPTSFNNSGVDENAVPQAEMISVATRLGLNIKGKTIAGANSSAKVEVDFAGSGSYYFLIRLRQAYMQLDWDKTSLLAGQTWHPMFGSVLPTGVSYNAGVPFQPFNRSPQLRINHHITPSLSLMAAAIYQMQYTSSGPSGASAEYMKKALQPDLFGGLEYKNAAWTSGLGIDYKRIKPDHSYISSISALAYAQYIKSMWQVKAKALIGQNLSDHLMPGGYGVSSSSNPGERVYTNINSFSSWLNVVYGKTWQVGVFSGYLQNLGSGMNLLAENDKFTIYGRGFYSNSQEMLDRLVRVAPMLIYNLPDFSVGLEYNLTQATYGKVNANGRVSQAYNVNNHRIQASVCYYF